jgi:hypothetical protein
MSDADAKRLRESAHHCRELAGVTRDDVVKKELIRLADEFEAEAEKVARRKPRE